MESRKSKWLYEAVNTDALVTHQALLTADGYYEEHNGPQRLEIIKRKGSLSWREDISEISGCDLHSIAKQRNKETYSMVDLL